MTSRCLTALEVFLADVLQHDLVERQIGHETFELGVFVPELLQLARLAGLEIAVLLFPAIEALLGNADLPTEIPNGDPVAVCCSTAVICSTENRFLFTARLLARWA
jgi:hypothetical protein